MTRPMRSTAAILALVAMLSACHSQQKARHGEVSGQILPGSVSDAMLPYDSVKSKAPLAPPEVVNHADNAESDISADSSGTANDPTVPNAAALPDAIAPASGN